MERLNKKRVREAHKEWIEEGGMKELYEDLLQTPFMMLVVEYLTNIIKYGLRSIYIYTFNVIISPFRAWKLFIAWAMDKNYNMAFDAYYRSMNSDKLLSELSRISDREIAYKNYVMLHFLVMPRSLASYKLINRYYWCHNEMISIRDAFDYVSPVFNGSLRGVDYDRYIDKIFSIDNYLVDIHHGKNIEWLSDEEWEAEDLKEVA